MMMKSYLSMALICLLLTSCSSFTQLLDTKSSIGPGFVEDNISRATLNNIDIRSNRRITLERSKSNTLAPSKMPFHSSLVPASLANLSSTVLESCLPLQFKYAIMMNATVEKITNVLLYQTIDGWFGTRYRYGGTTHKGIDCSAFMQVLSQSVFGLILPRTAHEQYTVMEDIDRDDLQEGDFVFFNTRGGVSHVGMYLQNNKFVHASTSKGVMISDLNDNYWTGRIIGYKRSSTDYTSL